MWCIGSRRRRSATTLSSRGSWRGSGGGEPSEDAQADERQHEHAQGNSRPLYQLIAEIS